MTTLVLLSRAVLWASFAGGLTFVIAYSLVPWWRSGIGRNMMAFAAAETLTLGVGAWALVFGDSPARRIVSLAAFSLFAATSWWRAATLIRAQLRNRRQPQPERVPS